MGFIAGRCSAYELNNAKKAFRITISALVIHDELDTVIEPGHADRIYENLASVIRDKHVLAGGGHGDLRNRPEYQGLVNGFVERLPLDL
ncbi:hypothetical protein OQ267_17755 [Pedobacter sp. MR22-3]|uniref:hypothetical protein n=1 Tax=Pedobacter psychrotolerans TaxID=1843235 RepID=UPI003F9DEE18|nr:hypothetical protein [Pedobacter sp. MR22-3]